MGLCGCYETTPLLTFVEEVPPVIMTEHLVHAFIHFKNVLR